MDSQSWRTAGVPEWQIEPGVCLHFDGTKSPNVAARETKWPYIYTYEDYISSKEANDINSVGYWSMDRGFWAPAGSLNTILTPALVQKYDADRPLDFITEPVPCASLDPAFGGDGCILQFGLKGKNKVGRESISLTEHREITISAVSGDEIDYQIARQTIEQCQAEGVTPANFSIDSTGVGRGVAAIIAQEWGDIEKVEFGGAPSNNPVSSDDNRPCKDVYDRKVTELWFHIKELVRSRRLGGLYKEAMAQFCSREYTIKGRKYTIDSKDICRKKIGRSPDHADAIAALCQLLNAETTNYKQQWDELVNQTNELWETSYA